MPWEVCYSCVCFSLSHNYVYNHFTASVTVKVWELMLLIPPNLPYVCFKIKSLLFNTSSYYSSVPKLFRDSMLLVAQTAWLALCSVAWICLSVFGSINSVSLIRVSVLCLSSLFPSDFPIRLLWLLTSSAKTYLNPTSFLKPSTTLALFLLLWITEKLNFPPLTYIT